MNRQNVIVTSAILAWLSSASAFAQPPYTPGDFSGDHKADAVVWNRNSGEWRVSVTNPNASQPLTVTWPGAGYLQRKEVLCDF